MKVGAEPKKIFGIIPENAGVVLLAGLLVVAAFAFYVNVLSGPDDPGASAPRPVRSDPASRPDAAPASTARQSPNISRANSRVTGSQRDFKPQIGFGRDQQPDPSTIDPSLRLDLIAKVQAVDYQASSRSLFQFATAPPPPVKPTPPVTIQPRMIGPEPPPPPPVAAAPPPPPKAPPIPLKFYGFTTPRRDGTKRAFFLDGEDIVVAAEGELVKRRYKVVRIGVGSVVMSDTQFTNDSQTLPIAPEAT